MSVNKDCEVIAASQQGDWVRYWNNPIAGEKELKLLERFAVLVVLDGKIDLVFNGYNQQTVGKDSLVVIDRQQLVCFRWAADTAILEYTPPEKIFRFFDSCSTSFQVPCSTIVPVRPKLQKWIDDLMDERLQPKEMLTNIRRRDYCVRLGNIIRSYPPIQVGELIVPFHACSLSGEKKCKGVLCE